MTSRLFALIEPRRRTRFRRGRAEEVTGSRRSARRRKTHIEQITATGIPRRSHNSLPRSMRAVRNTHKGASPDQPKRSPAAGSQCRRLRRGVGCLLPSRCFRSRVSTRDSYAGGDLKMGVLICSPLKSARLNAANLKRTQSVAIYVAQASLVSVPRDVRDRRSRFLLLTTDVLALV